MSLSANLVLGHDANCLETKMRKNILAFCAYANEAGVHIRPSRGKELVHFKKLSNGRQKEIYDNFNAYHDIYSSSIAKKVSLRDDKQILWWALSKMQLRPTSDVFEVIEQGDIVEIYDRMGTQIYRNFAFFAVSSYTLDEIFSSNWMSLFHRKDHDLKELYEIAEKVYGDRVEKTRFVDLHHLLQEIRSMRMNTIDVHHKYISPLHGPAGSEALVIVSSAKIIGQLPAIDRREDEG